MASHANVYLVSNTFQFLESYKKSLTRHLLESGHSVQWVFPEPIAGASFSHPFPFCKAFSIDSPRSRRGSISFLLFVFFKAFLLLGTKDEDVHIVSHTFFCNIATLAARLLSFRPLPTLTVFVSGFGPSRIRRSVRFRLAGRVYIKLLQLGSVRANCKVVVLNPEDRTLVQDYNRKRQVFFTFEAGVDTSTLPENLQHRLSSLYVPSDNRPLKLGFVGRLLYEKGVDDLIDLTRYLEILRIPFSLSILGASDPANNSSLSSQDSELLLRHPSVSLSEEAHHFYRGIDVLLFPSHREGHPRFCFRQCRMELCRLSILRLGFVMMLFPALMALSAIEKPQAPWPL